MPYGPGGSSDGQAPATANYSGLAIQQLEAIFQTPPSDITGVANNWKDLADKIRAKILGQDVTYAGGPDPLADGIPANPQEARAALSKLSTADQTSFDGILRTLQSWQGAAADEFISKALQVRAFGMNIVQRCYQLAEDVGGTWSGYTFHDTLGTMAQDLADAEQVYSATHDGRDPGTGNPDPNQGSGLRFGRGRTAQNIWDLLNNQQVWTWGFLDNVERGFSQGTMTSPNPPSSGTYSFADGTAVRINSNNNGFTFDYQPDKFFINVPYHMSGQVSIGNNNVTLQRYPAGNGAPTNPQTYSLGQITTDDIMAFYAGDYQRQLGDLLTAFAVSYVVAKTQLPVAPTPPKGLGQNSSSTTTPTYGPGSYGGGSPYGNLSGVGAGSNGNVPGYGTGGASGGSYNPGTGVVGTYHPGIPNGGGYNPGSYNPGQYPGGSGGPGSPNAGGWNPTQLAGYNPNLGGSGFAPGSTGFASGGPGAQSGGGLGPAGGGALTGAGGAGGAVPGGGPGGTAGGSGAAGRAMPMAPMGGAGGGKEGKERQRAAWLSEDEDVWGVDDDGGDAVL